MDGRGRGRARGRGRDRRIAPLGATDREPNASDARKIVVRRLPATLRADAVERALDDAGFVPRDAYFTWVDYRPGKGASGRGGRASATSRLYCACASAEAARRTRDAFEGAVFRVRARDEDGNVLEGEGAVEETRAIVELAPSQWTPRTFGERYATTREDERVNELEGTIESDEEYLKFVKALEEERAGGRAKMGAVMPKPESTHRKSTALLEYLWKKRSAEERASGATGASAKKKSSKKKREKSSKDGPKRTGPQGQEHAGPTRQQSSQSKTNKKPRSKSAVAGAGQAAAPKRNPNAVVQRSSSVPTPRKL